MTFTVRILLFHSCVFRKDPFSCPSYDVELYDSKLVLEGTSIKIIWGENPAAYRASDTGAKPTFLSHAWLGMPEWKRVVVPR